MADAKISQLPAATTPLSGTELVPVVQGTSTKKVPASALGVGAVAAHEAAADPHPQYLTAAEGNAAYATLAQGAKADTAIQPAGLASYVQTSDARLSDQRVPTDNSVTDAKITSGGLSAGSINWVSIQPWQPLTPYSKGDLVEQAGIAYRRSATGTSAATFNIANWQQVTPSAVVSHVHSASAITGLATVATTGSYGDLSGRPTLGGAAALSVGTTAGTVAAGDDSRLSDAREWTAATITQAEAEAGTATTRRAFTALRVFQAAAAWWTSYRSVIGDQLATASSQSAARGFIGAGVSNVTVSNSAPAALAASASAGTSADAARADHVHARSTYADLGAIGDGLILVVSNKGETATASTNYVEMPVPVPSGSFTLTAVRFGCHIDNTGSSSTTFNAYKRTAAGTKTSVLTGNATLGAAASLVDVSGTITGGTLSAGDRIGVDLIGVGTGAQGLFAQFVFTRSAT